MAHKVLVIEDSVDLSELYLQAFSHEDEYEIVLAENGQKALEILQNETQMPEAILVDMYMPVMGGARFIEEQRKNPQISQIPVLICSASEEGLPEGVRHLKKPIDLNRLMDALDELCQIKRWH